MKERLQNVLICLLAFIVAGVIAYCAYVGPCYAAYLVPANEVGTTLSDDFIYGTHVVIQISSLTDFPTGGGVVRLDDGTHWCLVMYGSVDAGTVELRTLTTPVADYESTAAHTFAAGVEVWLVCAADYIMQFVTALADTTTDHGIVRFDGVIGKMQNSGVLIDDSNNISAVNNISFDTISSDANTTINIILGSDAGDDLQIDTDKVTIEGDTGRVGINDTTPDALLDVEGNAFIGDASNYTEIKTDGEINLHGTARVTNHIRLGAASWVPGSVAPVADFIGIVPTLKFDATHDDEAHYSIIAPYRMVTGSVIAVEVCWAYDGGNDVGTVNWKMEYINLMAGEAVAGGTATITQISAGNHADGAMVCTDLAVGITGAVAGDLIGMRLWRDFSEDTLATDAELLAVHLHFTADKLGDGT